ncbi:ATP-binding cassette domain-containing protein [Heliobacterium undosum]|uniref:ATP-binding cassette domain-containing protein n=1 Tax=Heliomicrobium undosum TaxID=121734 RepID=A0A845L3L5_9FIRM|nr:ABC transporter ATP-binding protein [Heliomicrobium undosum]MZP30873.1 ATP-binding cassette domain-containing protein [Heliomicrobium undosum]
MIRLVDINMAFGSVQAVKDLNLEIGEGTIFGFVGPNGAGKSTTMLILATLLRPTSGQAFIDGFDVVRQPREARRRIGYMPDFFGVYDNLKAAEYLDFYAACQGIPPVERPGITTRLLTLVDLADKADVYVDSLSRGMKQRLGLARCLVHDPPALILDEPASGLDPRARVELREILKRLREMGKTVLISSHILPELAEMCDDIGILDKGRLVARGSVAAIRSRVQGRRSIRIRLKGQVEPSPVGEQLRSHPAVVGVTADKDEWIVAIDGGDDVQAEVLRGLIEKGLPVLSFAEAGSNLEAIFMEITGEAEG